MNEQDIMIQEKIEKREKTDIIIAYILIAIITCCLLFVVYLKFIKKGSEEETTPTEYTINNISLNDIASSLINNLSSKYNSINAIPNGNNITVTYGDISYNIPLQSNELIFTIDNDNALLSKDIYTEIIASVCTFYRSDREGCKNAARVINETTSVNGVRFVNNNVYIDIVNSVFPIEEPVYPVYNSEVLVDINESYFEVEMNNSKISNIKVDNSDNITITGDITYTSVKESSNVIIRLYDENNTLLEEKSIEEVNDFSIIFENSDTLKLESVKKYSIVVE